MVICPMCGTAVREGKAFCFNCGAAMNAAREDAKEASPEFRDTVIAPPHERPAHEPAMPSPATPRAVEPAGIARAVGSDSVVTSAPTRRGFFGGRAWIVILLLLLLLVLGCVAWAMLAD